MSPKDTMPPSPPPSRNGDKWAIAHVALRRLISPSPWFAARATSRRPRSLEFLLGRNMDPGQREAAQLPPMLRIMAFYPARDSGRQVSWVAEWRKSHFTSIKRFRYCSYLQRFLICRVRGDSPYRLRYEASRGISKPSYPLPSIFHATILTVWAKHLFISPLCKGPRGILGVPPATPYSWLEDIPPNGKLNGPGERYYILFPKFLKWRFPSFVQEAFFSIWLRGPK